MTNYYEELNLNFNDSLEEINKQLNQQERVWHQREVNNAEKATKKLSLIMEARHIFKSEATRAEYNYQLNKSKNNTESTVDEEKLQWKECAKEYYESQQYDLAKTAIERVFTYPNISQDDIDLFSLAAKIYNKNDNYSVAMEYINKAIISAHNVAEYYITKGIILEKQRWNADLINRDILFNSTCRTFEIAINKAQNSNDIVSECIALGCLSSVLYYSNPADSSLNQKAEQLALRAIELGGDPWGNADNILSEINVKREEKENFRKSTIYTDAINKMNNSVYITELEDVIEQLKQVIDYKDARNQIEQCNIKIQEIREERKRKKEEKEEKSKKKQTEIEAKIAMMEAKKVADEKRRNKIKNTIEQYDQYLTEWASKRNIHYCPKCQKEISRKEIYENRIWLCDCGHDILKYILANKSEKEDLEKELKDLSKQLNENKKFSNLKPWWKYLIIWTLPILWLIWLLTTPAGVFLSLLLSVPAFICSGKFSIEIYYKNYDKSIEEENRIQDRIRIINAELKIKKDVLF